jgi:hypothetical protein
LGKLGDGGEMVMEVKWGVLEIWKAKVERERKVWGIRKNNRGLNMIKAYHKHMSQ